MTQGGWRERFGLGCGILWLVSATSLLPTSAARPEGRPPRVRIEITGRVAEQFRRLRDGQAPGFSLQPTLPREAFFLTETATGLTEALLGTSSLPAPAPPSPRPSPSLGQEEVRTVTVVREVSVPTPVETIKEVKEVVRETVVVEKPIVQRVIEQADLSTLNADYLISGTLPLGRLPAVVSLLGQTIEPGELNGKLPYPSLNLAGSITDADIAPNAAIGHSKLDLSHLDVLPLIPDGGVGDAKLSSSYLQLGSGLGRGDKLYSGAFSFDGSYNTGGELVSLESVFTATIRAVIVTSSKAGKLFEVDESLFGSRQFKLKVIRSNNGNEELSGVNLSSLTNVRYLAIGQ